MGTRSRGAKINHGWKGCLSGLSRILLAENISMRKSSRGNVNDDKSGALVL
jgi:hypothetical protein